MTGRRIASLCVIAAAFAPRVAAQDTTLVAPGDRVKVLAPLIGRWEWHGTFVAVRGDSVALRGRDADSALVVLPISKIARFDVNHGNRAPTTRALEGFAYGTATGLMLGVITASYYTCTYDCGTSKSQILLVATAGGAAIGTLIGVFYRHAEPYSRVWLRPQPTALILPDRRVALGVSLRL